MRANLSNGDDCSTDFFTYNAYMRSSEQPRYIVATIKPWNIAVFKRRIAKFPGVWHLITDSRMLTPRLIKKIRPRYIFFPHWSWKVPKEILDAAPCVCFHETDVPYGRGGSPIQNLITRGHRKTKISALRMEEGLDTGPVYLKKSVSLLGTAQEIFERNAHTVANMIETIIVKNPQPKSQKGKVMIFKRRTPEESDIAKLKNLTISKLFDHIRMLDAPTYPHAYIDVGPLRLEFTDASLGKGELTAAVTVRKRIST